MKLNLIHNIGLSMTILAVVSVEAKAGLVLTAEAPGIQATTVPGVTTETFNDFSTQITSHSLATAVGTLSSGAAIVSADQYGGSGGVGNYAAIGAQSHTTSMTLTLTGPQAYFGFEWSAADPYNYIQFYNGNTLIGEFNPVTALGALSNPGYYGNPAPGWMYGKDSHEKFAYLNVFGTDGTTITSIVFGNQGTGSGFEVDNFSVRTAPVIPEIHGQVIHGGISSVPEPSSMALTGSALFAGIMIALRSRREKS